VAQLGPDWWLSPHRTRGSAAPVYSDICSTARESRNGRLSKLKLQLLISTMCQNDSELIKRMNVNSAAVVINQGSDESVREISAGPNKVTWINSTDRGLSKSRNHAIRHATADICLLADDDEVFANNCESIILEQFSRNPEYDIIVFQVEGIEKKFKDYYPKERSLGFLYSMKVSSVEIAFRLNRIKEKGIKFNELFGAGAKYSAGEENIFLFDCLRRGMKIKYVPVKIADLHIGDSTWFKGYTEKYFIDKGAIFTAMSKSCSKLLILQFALRKYKLYADSMTFREVTHLMFKGRREYLSVKDCKNQLYSK